MHDRNGISSMRYWFFAGFNMHQTNLDRLKIKKKKNCRFGTHRRVIVQECWRCRRRCVAKRRWWSSLDQSSTLWTLLIASRRWTCTHRFSLSLGLPSAARDGAARTRRRDDDTRINVVWVRNCVYGRKQSNFPGKSLWRRGRIELWINWVFRLVVTKAFIRRRECIIVSDEKSADGHCWKLAF